MKQTREAIRDKILSAKVGEILRLHFINEVPAHRESLNAILLMHGKNIHIGYESRKRLESAVLDNGWCGSSRKVEIKIKDDNFQFQDAERLCNAAENVVDEVRTRRDKPTFFI